MKVYVDDNDDYRITYSSRDGSECLETMGMQPIIVESLADYTKQVRKEVLADIEKRIINYFRRQDKKPFQKSIEQIKVDLLTSINQLQGENDGR